MMFRRVTDPRIQTIREASEEMSLALIDVEDFATAECHGTICAALDSLAADLEAAREALREANGHVYWILLSPGDGNSKAAHAAYATICAALARLSHRRQMGPTAREGDGR